ncbi:DUF7159 family protein [Mycolicibacterium goodii]|uniref:DUF7159 family protein n=1 Tax=Mycolicibacterium goodii TaxID=134601 RepID=UPI001BDD406B|nr:hypothetical protein [Mycolicibacterium goodii]MBU8832905.1 hypothetical protein [Mycolicibacterium goodii]
MDLVLGLAMTSRAIRWVLVEGTTGAGDPVDRGAIAVDDAAAYEPDGLLRGLVDDTVADGRNRIHAIGVTWTSDAAALAGHVMGALESWGHTNVFAVSEVEAAGILASGIAEITGHDDVAVCIIESDAAVAATVTADAVSADRIARTPGDDSSAELIENLKAVLQEATGGHTDGIFLLGSECDDLIVASLAETATVPVVSAAEADLAYPRGAALAAALAVNTPADEPKRLHLTKVGVLTSVLGAAVVTLVVATSAAVGIQLHPGAVAPAAEVAEAGNSVPAAKPATPAAAPRPKPPAAPAPAREAVPAPEAAPAPAAPAPEAAPAPAAPAPEAAPAPVAEVNNVPVAEPPAYVPPAPEAPAPEPAYVPPAPAYVPPPPPAFIPPPPPPPVTYPQPRLRDRIIERIPIINRFHEPKPWG